MPRTGSTNPLRSVPLFADLTRRELHQLAAVTTELRLAPGDVIIRQGDVARDMFVVADGSLDVTRDGHRVAVVEAGSFVGEAGLLTGDRRNATVSAVDETTVYHIDGRALDNVLDRAPRIAVKMLRSVALRAAA